MEKAEDINLKVPIFGRDVEAKKWFVKFRRFSKFMKDHDSHERIDCIDIDLLLTEYLNEYKSKKKVI